MSFTQQCAHSNAWFLFQTKVKAWTSRYKGLMYYLKAISHEGPCVTVILPREKEKLLLNGKKTELWFKICFTSGLYSHFCAILMDNVKQSTFSPSGESTIMDHMFFNIHFSYFKKEPHSPQTNQKNTTSMAKLVNMTNNRIKWPFQFISEITFNIYGKHTLSLSLYLPQTQSLVVAT